MTKRVRTTNIVFAVSVIIGIAIILLPFVVSRINEKRAQEAIAEYEAAAQAKLEAEHEADFQAAQQYNQALKAGILSKETLREQYDDILNVQDGMMGYIEIPRLGIRDPIYHTTEENVLQRGIGHIETTSLPVGGNGTHAALSGHRGLPGSKLFTDLDQIKNGDKIFIKIYSHTLAYEVYDVEVVEPKDVKGLSIEEGRDLLTLVTCTPYAVNSHRLLVHAERVEYIQEDEDIVVEHHLSESDRIVIISLLIVFAIIALDLVVVAKYQRDRKIREENRRKNRSRIKTEKQK